MVDKFYPATNDVVFKAVFGSSTKILMGFLNQVVGLSIKSPDDISLLNPEIPIEFTDTKLSRLDIRVKTGEEQIDIEMQVENVDDYVTRSVVYESKMICDDIMRGKDYNTLHKAITINILNFDLFGCSEYQSTFIPMEVNRHEVLSDKWQVMFFELNKLPDDKLTDKEKWLLLLKSGKEGIDMFKNSDNEYIRECADKISYVNTEESLRVQAELRELSIIDERSRLSKAMRDGRAEGRAEGIAELVSKWKAKGFSDEQIQGLLT